MLQHLSSELFKERIADFEGNDKWSFKCDVPTIILFKKQEHILAKGFRDIYEPINQNFPDVKTYEVLVDENPEIPTAYEIDSFPSTMFIKPGAKAKIINGFLTPAEAINDVRDYLFE